MAGVIVDCDGPIASITIDRPEAMNAISRDTMSELLRAIETVERSESRVVVLTGGGDRVFVSGGDLKELAALRSADEAIAMANRMRDVLDRLAGLPVPVIGAINGSAFGGGCEVALACDYRIAPHDVRFAFNQIDLAIMPAWGGLERLCDLVGYGRAMYLATTGSRIGAATAAEWGLVELVVDRAEFESTVSSLARRVATGPRSAAIAIKRVANSRTREISTEGRHSAVESFARLWVAEEHWQAAESALTHRKKENQSVSTKSKIGAADGTK